MRVFLIGFMGSGKSTFGKKLAKKMNFNFLDSDKVIEKNTGLTISQLFDQHGEVYFRNLELIFIESLDSQNTIIALGGGFPCAPGMMDRLNKSGTTVYLHMNANALYDRLLNAKEGRPLVDHLKSNPEELKVFVKNKLEERESYYKQAKIEFSGLNLTNERMAILIEELEASQLKD